MYSFQLLICALSGNMLYSTEHTLNGNNVFEQLREILRQCEFTFHISREFHFASTLGDIQFVEKIVEKEALACCNVEVLMRIFS